MTGFWKPQKTTLKKLIIPALSISAFIAAAAIDTADYRAAVENFSSEKTINMLKSSNLDITSDLDSYARCNQLLDNKTGEITQQSRDCLTAAMPQTKTYLGALAVSGLADSYLTTHTGDSAFRAAALIAIENGWKNVANQMRYFDVLENISDAHDHSFLLRHIDGRYANASPLNLAIDIMEKAELAVRYPGMREKQASRRLALYHSINQNPPHKD